LGDPLTLCIYAARAGSSQLRARRLNDTLAADLATGGLKGISSTYLWLYREFYSHYPQLLEAAHS
jgi:hypothetical protein